MNQLASPGSTHLAFTPILFSTGRRAGTTTRLASARAILVVALEGLGECVLYTAFLRELRRNAPQAWITLVVRPEMTNLFESSPYTSEVLPFEWRTSLSLPILRRHFRALLLSERSLWHRRFDLALLPRWDADYCHGPFVAYFSGARHIIGYSERGNATAERRVVNKGQGRLLTVPLNGPALRHEAERGLDLLVSLGGNITEKRLEVWPTNEDFSYASEVLRGQGVTSDQILVAFAPGAAHPRRRWPPARFVELARRLDCDFAARFVLLGGSGEEEALGLKLQSELGNGAINLVGRATIRQAAAVLKHCRIMISDDTGTMHLAAAAGTPVVEISCHPASGSPAHVNSPFRFHPWGVPHRVAQPDQPLEPCRDGCAADEAHCILGVNVDSVYHAVHELAAETHCLCAEPDRGREQTVSTIGLGQC